MAGADSGVLEELAPFVEGGVAILVGSADPDNVPDAVRGWGATVADGCSLRLLLPALAPALWANLASTGRIAICFTDVATYRSVQVKGIVAELPSEATDEDGATWERYKDRFFLAVEAGSMVPRSMTARLLPSAIRPAVVEVRELFDQTPGPTAGRSIEVGNQ